MLKILPKNLLPVVFILLAVILAGSGLWFYNALFAEDRETETQLLEQFGEDFFYHFDLDKPFTHDPERPLTLDKDADWGDSDSSPKKTPEEDNQDSPDNKSENTSAENSEEEPDSEHENPPTEDPEEEPDETRPPDDSTVAKDEILAEYKPKFRSLEAQAKDRLEILFNEGIKEYRQQKEDGTLDKFELTNKYIQAGRMLEKSVDEKFYSLLTEFRQELETHDFSTVITKEIEQHYESSKRSKKRELLSRVSEERK